MRRFSACRNTVVAPQYAAIATGKGGAGNALAEARHESGGQRDLTAKRQASVLCTQGQRTFCRAGWYPRMVSCGRVALGLPDPRRYGRRTGARHKEVGQPAARCHPAPQCAARKLTAVSKQRTSRKIRRSGEPNPTPLRSRLCNSCDMSVRLQSRGRK